MSFFTRINQLFSPPEPVGVLGLSLQQQIIASCMVSEANEVQCQSTPVLDGQYAQAMEQLNQHASGQAHLVLSAKQHQLVQIDRPQVPDEEVNAAVKWQVKDLVSITPEDMILDYFDGPKLSGGADKINVVCASKQELTEYVAQLNKHRTKLKSITIEEFAFASLSPVQSEARLMVCQQPNEDVLLLIIKDGSIYFTRRLRGLDRIGDRTEEELSQGVIDSLSLEIQRSTDYFERQLKQAPIRSIEVLVPIEKEAFLARRLAENSSVPVNLFAMPDGFAEQREFAVCIGATMLKNMGEEN